MLLRPARGGREGGGKSNSNPTTLKTFPMKLGFGSLLNGPRISINVCLSYCTHIGNLWQVMSVVDKVSDLVLFFGEQQF